MLGEERVCPKSLQLWKKPSSLVEELTKLLVSELLKFRDYS